ncbi:MAG: hypothetical protein PHS14_02935 [Elusimicrobia bacterium]|nr:hypothetical protein [Elusimicrobiota bacterium]
MNNQEIKAAIEKWRAGSITAAEKDALLLALAESWYTTSIKGPTGADLV